MRPMKKCEGCGTKFDDRGISFGGMEFCSHTCRDIWIKNNVEDDEEPAWF